MSPTVSDIRHSSFDIRHSPLVSVCSEIGRGHPSYLDSVLLALDRLQGARTAGESGDSPSEREDARYSPLFRGHVPRLTVPELCTGPSGLAWRLARFGYRFGSRGGVATWLYNRLRSPETRPSAPQLGLLGSSLRKTFADYEGICIVDHPLLAQILAPVCRVAYVHGEIAAPGSSAAPGAWRNFIPLDSTAARLQAVGVRREALTVTGLLVEPQFLAVAETAFAARLVRIESDQPLTVAFFASGAYPRPHVERTLDAASSVTRAGHKAILFWGSGMLRAAKMQAQLRRHYVAEDAARVVWSRSRTDETGRVAEAFGQIDLMVAASHERTNWAVGLGIPMFALLPHIGPFAEENYAFASEQGVCLPLATTSEAAQLGDTIAELHRTGRLDEMARSGWGRYPINGAETIARELLSVT